MIATLETVRTVVYSAAPMTLPTLQRALAMLPDAGFLNLYGQTEAIVSGLPRELHALDGPDAANRLRSVGFPFPGVQVRILDEDGRNARQSAKSSSVRTPCSAVTGGTRRQHA